ncbi:MAG: hypothetical protein Q3966_02360 [Neisseria sp.]|nr:hypothetical protein [Neisseria sp.]
MQNFLFVFTAVTVAAFIAAGIYFLLGAIREGRAGEAGKADNG